MTSPLEDTESVTATPGARPAGAVDRQKSRSRAYWQALLQYGGSVVVLFLLFKFLPAKAVWAALRALPPMLWIAAIGIYLGGHCVGIVKWRLMVNTAGAGLSTRQAARCYFAGLFGSLFLPSLIGGDLVRAALAMKLGKSKAAVLLGSFLDRGIDLAALAVLAASGAMLVPRALNERSRTILGALGAVALVAVIVGAALVVLIPVKRFGFRIRRRLLRLRAAARSMVRRPQVMLAALALALIAQTIFILLNSRLAAVCGLALAFRVWLFAWPLAKLSAALPITQGGIGVREAALAALLLPFGAPAALSVAAGLAWEAIVISGALVAGALSLLLGQSDRA